MEARLVKPLQTRVMPNTEPGGAGAVASDSRNPCTWRINTAGGEYADHIAEMAVQLNMIVDIMKEVGHLSDDFSAEIDAWV